MKTEEEKREIRRRSGAEQMKRARATEEKVRAALALLPSVVYSRLSTTQEDEEGIDVVAGVRCGPPLKFQVKSGKGRGGDGYAARGIVVVRRASTRSSKEIRRLLSPIVSGLPSCGAHAPVSLSSVTTRSVCR